MRFPRTNLTDAGDFSSGLEAEHPENAPVEYEGEKPVPPLWQSNFSLAPNVRFTRTPETLISKRHAPERPVREEIVAPPPQAVVAPQPAAAPQMRAPITVNVPFDIYLPEVAETIVAPQPESQPQPAAAIPVETTLRAATELSSISDFAFWEVMAFEETDAAPSRTPVIALQQAEPESITSRFRIMEWRPGRHNPAPVAPRATLPVAPAPVRPARPPAARVAPAPVDSTPVAQVR